MILIAASCPSNSDAAVTMRILFCGVNIFEAIAAANLHFYLCYYSTHADTQFFGRVADAALGAGLCAAIFCLKKAKGYPLQSLTLVYCGAIAQKKTTTKPYRVLPLLGGVRGGWVW